MKIPTIALRPASAVAAFRDEVEELRREIVTARDERKRLRGLPLPLGEAVRRLDDWLDRVEDEAITVLPLYNLTRSGPDVAAGLDASLPVVSTADGVAFDVRPAVAQVLGLLVASNRDRLRGVVIERLREWYGDRDTATPGEADARIAEIDAKLLRLELQEERLIREAEAAGLTVLRRADLDPRVALAADEALRA